MQEQNPHVIFAAPIMTAPPPVADEALLNSKQVCQWLGNVSLVCLHKWRNDPTVSFPEPNVVLGRRNYWTARAVRSWLLAKQAAAAITKPPSVVAERVRRGLEDKRLATGVR
jgi:hypothetical protein